MNTFKVKLLLGAALLLAGIILMVCEELLSFFNIAFGYIPFLSISFFVAGLVLLSLLVSRKVKLLLGTTLLLVGVLLLVCGWLFLVNTSIPLIFAGSALLMTHVPWKKRLLVGAALLLTGILLFVISRHLLIFSILLGLAGLILLATLAHGKTTDLRKPTGVTAVGVFVLLCSIGLGYFIFMIIALSGIGSFGYSSAGISAISEGTSLFILSLTVFALSGLLLSIIVLRGLSSKYLWYCLMAYWISLLAYSFVRDFTSLDYYAQSFWLPYLPIFLLPTYIYPAICIAYFLTKKPRQYFHLIGENTLKQQTTT